MNASAATKFKLRRMRLSDIDQVHTLEERIFPTPWTRKSYEFELEHNTASEQWIIEAWAEHKEWVIVAYTVCWQLGDELHVANLAVAPKYRRRGLGKRLLHHVLERAAEKGMKSATLEVRSGNQAAQSLYTSFGFEVVGRRKRYYSNNHEDALLMQLPSLDGSALNIESVSHIEQA
jgi:ribosomal-protein-alanine N-acetyltransferase